MFTYATALPEHAEGIQEVFYRTWLSTYPNEEYGITVGDVEERFKDRLSEERILKRRENLAHPPKGEYALVALEDGKVIGMCRVRTEHENRIQQIYVLPEYQGKGVGSGLWRGVQKYFEPGKDIHVAVAVYNKKAIAFYAKLGFVDTGKRFTEERLRMKSGAEIPQMDMVLKRA